MLKGYKHTYPCKYGGILIFEMTDHFLIFNHYLISIASSTKIPVHKRNISQTRTFYTVDYKVKLARLPIKYFFLIGMFVDIVLDWLYLLVLTCHTTIVTKSIKSSA